MPPKPNRSPVLGYNHNLKYRGRIFHIQTEDSGPQNPRLFTHLYFGGTILASKKHEYDPAAPEDVVRALMQSQHKSILKELKAGKHDDRIVRFFSARGETLEASASGTAEALSADPQALDLDAAPDPARKGQDTSTSSVEIPALPPPSERPTAPSVPTFADTFEDEPTTPDERHLGAPAPAAAAAAAAASASASASGGDKTIEMDMREVLADAAAGGGLLSGRRRPARTPALGAPVTIERPMSVGGKSGSSPQSVVGGIRNLFRRKPAPSIPYVVKEGSHPLADPQPESPPPPAMSQPVPLSPPPTTAANASITSTLPGHYPHAQVTAQPAEKSLDEVILAYLAQGGDDR